MIIHASGAVALPMAITALARGDLVVLPTETVYGLAGISTSAAAIAKIYDTKERPRSNPLISHVSGLEMAAKYVGIDAVSQQLAEAFWPGPLTLILRLRENGIHRSSTAGQDYAAIRAPANFAHQVISEIGLPLAAPSANRSGRISPTTAAHAAAELGDRVSLIIDDGPSLYGVESTVLRVDQHGIAILRPGALTSADIAAVTDCAIRQPYAQEAGLSPGTMTSHYAPRALIRLEADHVGTDEAVLTFGNAEPTGIRQAAAVFNLSPSGDPREAARNLFDMLHQADATGADCIAVVPIPATGLGVAINDRLRRAAAPRPLK